jgi:8-oxo-dGTP pyrophosphatase MutT (NUDIX family)
LTRMVSNMTTHERIAIRSTHFDILWKNLWQTEDCRGFFREYTDAKKKFETLKRGYTMRDNENSFHFDLNFILDSTTSVLAEPEWGFPKGRRNINESDFSCAIREFREETGVNPKCIHCSCIKPYEEVFSGSNSVRYKHIYYIARHKYMEDINCNPKNKLQSREVQSVKWFGYKEAQSHIRSINIERKELLKRVNNMLHKNMNNSYGTGYKRM